VHGKGHKNPFTFNTLRREVHLTRCIFYREPEESPSSREIAVIAVIGKASANTLTGYSSDSRAMSAMSAIAAIPGDSFAITAISTESPPRYPAE